MRIFLLTILNVFYVIYLAIISIIYEIIVPFWFLIFKLRKLGQTDDFFRIHNWKYGRLHKGAAAIRSSKRNKSKEEFYVKLGKKKIEENEKDLKAITELALQYTTLNNYDEALVLWRKALKLEPQTCTFLSLYSISQVIESHTIDLDKACAK